MRLPSGSIVPRSAPVSIGVAALGNVDVHREQDPARPGRRVGGGLVALALDHAFAAVEDAVQRLPLLLLPVVAVVLPVGIALDVDRAARHAQARSALLDRDDDDLGVARVDRAAPADAGAPAAGQARGLFLVPAPGRDAAAAEDERAECDQRDPARVRRRRCARRFAAAPSRATGRSSARPGLVRGTRPRPRRSSAEARQVLAPVVGAQTSPGQLRQLAEGSGQLGRRRDRDRRRRTAAG